MDKVDAILKNEYFCGRLLTLLQETVNKGFRGFSLKYQPIVRAGSGELYGYEVLLRWEHKEFPQGVTPDKFIPILEESGLILEVGRWVFEEAVKQAAKWKNIMPKLQMSVNVSSSQFEETNFKFFIMHVLGTYGVKASTVTLELTESGQIDNPKEMEKVFDFIRSQGIKIAFDDFGMGYASLDIFRVLSADELKIDRSFLERITYDVNDQKIITQIINLCNSMNMVVCVEGIENTEIENVVCQLGPEFLQGFYYNKPMTANEFAQYYFQSENSNDTLENNQNRPERNKSMVYSPLRPVQPMSMEQIVDNAHAGIFQVGMDAEFSFLTCNEGYRRMLGYTAKEIEEKFKNRALGFVHPDDMEYVNDEIRRQLSLGDTVIIEFRVVKSNGKSMWILGTGNVVKNPTGGASLIVVIIETGNYKRRKSAIERPLSQYDKLTGLLNKGTTETNIRQMLAEANEESKYALFKIDIDNFKDFNEKWGHVNGDKVIVEMASQLKDFFGSNEIVGSAGGDEFLVFIPYVGDNSEIEKIACRLLHQLCHKVRINQQDVLVSVSIGIACYPEHGTEFYNIFKRADSAIYHAKEMGKGSYCFALG